MSSQPEPRQHVDTPVDGEVKWFDRRKGFGFVVPANDAGMAAISAIVGNDDLSKTDILLHSSVIEPHGRRYLPEQTRLQCRVAYGQRGLHVTEIIAFDAESAEANRVRAIDRLSDRDLEIDSDAEPVTARVKWFSRVKGYGFLIVDGHDRDVFLHIECLRDVGAETLLPDEELEIIVADSDRGPIAVEVVSIANPHATEPAIIAERIPGPVGRQAD